ncbi:diadenosine tetraphosphate hydrolase [Paramagnetospirillum marisnigri]|uniref:Diadenosine tetraphosphate hydrolase n=1 Tax=Paramagnetospirillum marisnigri TaxID=1285242 RepID=A0A178MDV1_9PROT|nr:HIT domain-containing protein [Paramagnetospirillum marisnigri]OAN46696.1 diadenosine tetraphosphate hydrolase [Paramagnetospirillum marisnigri]
MFVLHPRLEADTIAITDWPLCRVLLMKDANYPWLVLVPRRDGVNELTDLGPEHRAALMEEVTRASEGLRVHARPDRINVAALGNMVPQLHVHVIARFTTDAAWPKPVWGAAPSQPYTDEALTNRLMELRDILK